MVVVPVRFGTGTRGKITEGIAHQIPVVSTTPKPGYSPSWTCARGWLTPRTSATSTRLSARSSKAGSPRWAATAADAGSATGP